jgi:hypothetical protein
VPRSSLGTRLIRYAPARMACCCPVEMPLRPLRPLRMLEASLPASVFLNLGGGAKSKPLYVPDLRSKCLQYNVSFNNHRAKGYQDLRAGNMS